MSALDEVINNAPPAVGEMSELEGAKLGLTPAKTPPPSPSPYDPTPTPAPVVHPGVKEAIAGLDGIPGLVAQFKEADTPHANPPEAAKVLETQTAPEVAGEPEPLTDEQEAAITKADELAEFNEARVARGEKPLKRMPPEKKTRRTAPVVQVELDAANVFLEAARITIHERDAEIERLNALPMTASAVQDRDETIAALRDALECERELVAGLRATEASTTENMAAAEELVGLQAGAIRQLEQEPVRPERSTPMEILVDECESRGWKVTLSR